MQVFPKNKKTMPRRNILIVEDDKDISEIIRYNLEKEGFVSTAINNGEDVFHSVRKNRPELIILDIMLPGMDGLEVCNVLRKDGNTQNIPIIMLTAKSQEADKVVGLELGADDYIIKPFSPRELIARIKAVLRRGKTSESSERIEVGNIIIDELKHEILVCGKEIKLTSTEFKLLVFLSKKLGIVVSRGDILNSVFGYDSAVYDRTIDTHIKSLRKKIGKERDCIQTVRGFGYKFKDCAE